MNVFSYISHLTQMYCSRPQALFHSSITLFHHLDISLFLTFIAYRLQKQHLFCLKFCFRSVLQ